MSGGPLPDRFGGGAMALHWLSFALIAFMVVLGNWMSELPRGTERVFPFDLHMSVGLVILGLTVIRILWNRMVPTPGLPETLPLAARRLSRIVQGAILFLVLALPVTGVATVQTTGRPVSLFGWATLPQLLPQNRGLHEFFEETHEALILVLIGLVAVHVLAALWHHYALRDGVLESMLPGRRSPRSRQIG